MILIDRKCPPSKYLAGEGSRIPFPLEKELQAKLIFPGSPSGEDLAKVGIGDVANRYAELRVIPRIECFHAELKTSLFTERKILEKAEIPIVDTGRA